MGFAIDTLEYARRLQEAGFSEQQAQGQARALASAMTESLATKADLDVLHARFAQTDARIDALEQRMDLRLGELERRVVIRLEELEKRFELRLGEMQSRSAKDLADLERRMTMRLGGIMVAGIGVMTALTRLA